MNSRRFDHSEIDPPASVRHKDTMIRSTAFLVVAAAVGLSCDDTDTSASSCSEHSDCSGDAPYCEAETSVCGEPPRAADQLGWGDGSPQSVDFVTVLEGEDYLREPADLAFNPEKPTELWVVNRLDNSVAIIQKPGEKGMKAERRRDPAASHFMNRPPAIAMGSVDETWSQTFGVCGDNDGNAHDEFMGPALFTTMLDVFAKQTPGGLGSHLDMLHSTSFCRGIAHAHDNVYFVFNSQKGSVDRYDFAEDHDPGNDDHSDGEILRLVEGELTGVTDISSHLVFDQKSEILYIADTGTGRILTLDTKSGEKGKNFSGFEPVEERKVVEDAKLAELVKEGTLTQPSGVELYDGMLFVSDSATSKLHAFDLQGKLLRSLDTGLPEGSLSGFQIGPDKRLYFVDRLSSRIIRVDIIQ